MFEMFLFIIGIYTLVFGKIHLYGPYKLAGWRARVVSLFIMMPFPITILLRGIGNGLPPERAQSVFGLTELTASAAGILCAVLIAILTRPKDNNLP